MVRSGGAPISSWLRARDVPQWDQYTSWRSRSGPPKSSYTGTPSAFALMSQRASSMPAMAFGTLARHAIEVPVPRLHRAGIPADQDGLEVAHRADDPIGVAAVGALAVPRDAGVRADGHELPRTPARVDDERLDLRDLHGTSSARTSRYRARGAPGATPR
jgi:hypothetical protein